MKSWTFGVAVKQESNDYVVQIRDLPAVITSGDDLKDALRSAGDAMESVVVFMMKRGEPLPEATPILDKEYPVALPASLAAKASVYEAWRATNLTKTELARRMGRSEAEVRRILDPSHGTKLDQMEEAAKALGGRLSVAFAAE